MKEHLDFSVQKNCYAVTLSYGELCISCGCCGRFGTELDMWQVRLKYHANCLTRLKGFDQWLTKWEDIQKENIKKDKAYHNRKIKYCLKKISQLQPNEQIQ
jgi:hypothetical protein